MWCMILRQLKSPKDQITASKCSLYFRCVLLNARVNFLFEEMAGVLVSFKEETIDNDTEHVSVESCVTQKEVMICRRVCRSWNDAVARCYERPAVTGVYPFMDNQEKDLPGIFNPNEWANPYIFSVAQPFGPQRFINQFNSRETGKLKNPFLGRFVVISIGLQNMINNEIFCISMNELLREFGTEIWYAVFYISCSTFSTANKDYLKLRQWLTCMPNLKSLRLQFYKQGIVGPNVVTDIPLPQLSNLIHLGVSNVCVTFLNELFKRYCHVSYLQVTNCTSVAEWSPNLFTNLKGIFLDANRRVCSDIINWLGKSARPQILYVYNHEQPLRFCRQFQMIRRHWSDSIVEFTLKIEDYDDNRDNCTKSLLLKLPQLRRLKIYSYGYLCIDFVQPLKSLEVLDLSLYTDDSGVDRNSQMYQELLIPEQKVQLIGFEKRMQESNIWQIVVRLKILKIYITRRYPILCYEYTRNETGLITCKTFVQKPTRMVQVPYTFEYVFTNFHY